MTFVPSSQPKPLDRITDASTINRFLSKVQKCDDGTWRWTGAVRKCDGYGTFWIGGRVIVAHRIAYAIFKGPIPPDTTINHKRMPGEDHPNPLNVNPEYLELMSSTDNIAERNHRRSSEVISSISRCSCGSLKSKCQEVCRRCKAINELCLEIPV